MMGLLKKLQRRIDSLSERERGILLAVVITIILFAAKTLILDPQLKKQDTMKAQLQANQTQMAQLQSEMNMRMEKMGIDPDAEIKKRIANVKEYLQKIEKDLEQLFPRNYWSRVNGACVRFGKTYMSRRKKDEILQRISNS